ncbi:hypothetical protein B0J13DRAFT_567077 [Dactylonectria estremocensis]|uniref:C2H2-type domain-containing protein n=1 Tax=Dactylonectria estremocensis TaxID=1079267 RepID=A0A9P9IJ65_9HYPO|nr:hypothetical protein B0J13DRAFT_567077 [Dactylonectria estremocensis]
MLPERLKGGHTLHQRVSEAHQSHSTSRFKNVFRIPRALAYRLRSRSAHQGNPDKSGSNHNDPNQSDPNQSDPNHDDRDDQSRHRSIGGFAKRKPSLPPFKYHPNPIGEDNLREPLSAKQLLVHTGYAFIVFTRGQSRGNGGQSTSQGGNGKRVSWQGSWPSSMKRKGKQRDDDHPNKKPRDDPPDGKDSKKQKPGEADKDHKLACPFYLRDRSTHAKCRHYKFRSVADIRQHLERVHKQPLHCLICKHIFGEGREDARSRKQLEEHIRQRNCVNSEDEVPGLTNAEIQRLKNHDGRPGNIVDNWNNLWNMLFPGVQHPESPYHTRSDFQDKFQHYLDTIWESPVGQAVAPEERQAMKYWCPRFAALISDFEAMPSRPIASAFETPFPVQDSTPDPPPTTPIQTMRPITPPGSTVIDLVSSTLPLVDIDIEEPVSEWIRQQLEPLFPPPPPWRYFSNSENSAQAHYHDNNRYQGVPQDPNPNMGYHPSVFFLCPPEDQTRQMPTNPASLTCQHAQHQDHDESSGDGGVAFDSPGTEDYP